MFRSPKSCFSFVTATLLLYAPHSVVVVFARNDVNVDNSNNNNSTNTTTNMTTNTTTTRLFSDRIVVTEQAMGARCAVAADLDGDGRLDLVSASSNDNAVSWFRNQGWDQRGGEEISFSMKRQITWSSLGSRIVTVADIDGDGDMDVVGASYYDSSLRWFENDGTGAFTPHLISSAVNEGQGVTVADIDNDGDADIITASSGDHTIAVFRNLGKGIFCEIKQVVDNQAMGARTVVAADLNGDGWLDLVSASKDDDTVAWYPNNGHGQFHEKHIVSRGDESTGAYSLVAVDIDKDGDQDLIVASNGNDHVSLWRNDGQGNFTKTLIYGNADFVLSVTAVDFDRDGDLDVASASFFDGHINWYENVDGKGYEWRQHTVHVGVQGHYVSTGDMDGDGDDDLIAVTHAENTVAVFLARTECDYHTGDDAINQTIRTPECCHSGTQWNGTTCVPCGTGTYGIGSGRDARCVPCPTDSCTIPGFHVVPDTCSGITGCDHVEEEVATCSCPVNTVRDAETHTCTACPEGQNRPELKSPRDVTTLGNYTAWEEQQGICHVEEIKSRVTMITLIAFGGAAFLCAIGLFLWQRATLAKADALWKIDPREITYDDPVEVIGTGAFGEVWKATYRGTFVAVKAALPSASLSTKSGTFGFRVGTMSLSRLSGAFSSSKFPIEELESAPTKSLEGYSASKTFLGKQNGILSKKMKKMFVEEMRILSKLRHPFITTVMGAVSRPGDEPLLVMEYMEHGSLRDLLSNETVILDPEQTLRMIRDVLQGVRFLHAAKPPIIHADLKCSNVLVDGDFRAKIADFGLTARHRAGEMVGTPFWMAPELLRGGAVSTQSDVYAFGVLVWEVMTRKSPYEDLQISFKDIIRKIRQGKLRPDCQGLDKDLAECLQECWAQVPKCRPSLEDLELKIIPLCGHNFYASIKDSNQFIRKETSIRHELFPEHIAKALEEGKKVAAEHHGCVTICFIDIDGFSELSCSLSSTEVFDLLGRLYTKVDMLSKTHGVFKLETIGDSWVGVTNLTQAQNDHAARMASFSFDVLDVAQTIAIHPRKPEFGNVQVRIGFHSGPAVSNVVGTRNLRYGLFGDSVNTASRMEVTSEAQKIQCSEVSVKLARKFDKQSEFVLRGKIDVKGKGKMNAYWCSRGKANAPRNDNIVNSPTGCESSPDSMKVKCSEEIDLEAPPPQCPIAHTESQLKKWMDKHAPNESNAKSLPLSEHTFQ